ncbi:hypothetical protein [Pedobacter suwonensis]|uniref:hypothetical protein n=1 Tax=Pedobacter suwonensis TaxID=332999 RepID=UPI0011A9E039|nr:hypothetical protein [Pedobacter suwonensis]
MAIQKTNIANKATNGEFTASEFNAVKNTIDNNADELTNVAAALTGKASKVNGMVPTGELPPVYFTGLTGSGTQSDPYVVSAGGLSAEQLTQYFQSLPNWAADRILQGNLEWIDPPASGNQQKLATPNIVFGTAASDAIPISWDAIPFGVTYTLQRDTSIAFANPVNVYSGGNTAVTDIGLTASTQYFYRLRVSASGFASSDYDVDNKTTDVPGNVTPVAPTLAANDTNNTLSASHALGASEIVMSVNGAAYIAYPGTISVGDVDRPAGYWKFKIKSATGRNESPVVNSPAFTVTVLPKPAAPTVPVTDDVANTFNWTNTAGYGTTSSYQYTTDAGATWKNVTAKPIVIGDVDLGIGQVGVRIKAITNVNQASDILFNTVPFVSSEPDLSTAVTNYIFLTNTELVPGYDNWTQQKSGFDYTSMVAGYTIAEGSEGYVQMDVQYGIPSGFLILQSGTTNPPTGTNIGSPGMSVQLSVNYATGQNSVGGRMAGSFVQSLNVSTISKIRFRTDGATVYMEAFTTSWQQVSAAPHEGTLRIKGSYFTQRNGEPGAGLPNDGLVDSQIRNLKQYGFS